MLYATLDEIKRSAYKSKPKDDWLQEDKIRFASRFIDNRIGVRPGYFQKAPEASEDVRVFIGDGTRFLLIDPFVEISDVAAGEGENMSWLPPDYREESPYLVARGGACWPLDFEFEVAGRFGFDEVPDDINGACIELVIAAWKQRDASYLRVVAEVNDTNATSISGAAMPERVKMVIEDWRKRQLPKVVR